MILTSLTALLLERTSHALAAASAAATALPTTSAVPKPTSTPSLITGTPGGSSGTGWEVVAFVLGAIAIAEGLYIVWRLMSRPTVPPAGQPLSSLPSSATTPEPERRASTGSWESLVDECVQLYDELERARSRLDGAGASIAQHVEDRLGEILQRSGVDVINGDSTFDVRRHQPEPGLSSAPVGSRIQETVSPGFAIGRRVLRRATVRVDRPAPPPGDRE